MAASIEGVSVVALVLGAGRGERLVAGSPKALLRLAGRSLLAWSAGALASARGVDGVLCVVPGQGFEHAELARDWPGPARLLPSVVGGDTRQGSLARGLAALPAGVERVLVHDAARCLVEAADAERVLEAMQETGAAIPVVAPNDTVKQLRGEAVERTLERTTLALAQTPQGFRVELLREALEKAAGEGFEGTDCASLVERLGVRVRVCPGRPGNWKLTTGEDVERARATLEARAVAGEERPE
jgi:2-C-methyl-D-erythritol 4-phosphate cytidylyltransferase